MSEKILIGTATYNESENIVKLINSFSALYPKADILVVDDSSPDKTYNLLKLLKIKNKNLNLIIRKKKEGLNTAHKILYNFALKKKYNFLITMDADFSHNPKDIKKILSYLKFYDFVIGSRYISGGKCNMKFMRFLISKYGNLAIKYILKTNVSENTTSFRGFNLNKIRNKKFNLNLIKSNGYSFFMETIHYLRKKKCSIKEVPIVFNDRQYGESKIPKLETLRTLKNLLMLRALDFLNYLKK
jgi:dolichol-phosphate mannosyltransferase